jgi:hypothetical protein
MKNKNKGFHVYEIDILLTDAQSLLILNNVTYTVKTGKISFYGLSTKLIGD